jgi:hypothetical protein
LNEKKTSWKILTKKSWSKKSVTKKNLYFHINKALAVQFIEESDTSENMTLREEIEKEKNRLEDSLKSYEERLDILVKENENKTGT